MTGYYDLILGLIPLALGGITTVLVGFGLSLTAAVPLAAAVAVALIGHGLFVRAPGNAPAATPDTAPLNSLD